MKKEKEPTNTDMPTAPAERPMDAAIASEFESIEPLPNDLLVESEEADVSASASLVDGVVILRNGAQLPTEICVKTGKKSHKVIAKGIRNPTDPRTWFGRCGRVKLGLSRKQYENHLMARALTWSGVGVGSLLVLAGLFSLNVSMLIVGSLVSLVSGLGRIFAPVIAKTGGESESVELHGVGPEFLKQISWD